MSEAPTQKVCTVCGSDEVHLEIKNGWVCDEHCSCKD